MSESRMMTPREKRIQDILTTTFHPAHLEIVNESHLHSGQRQESHFKIHIVGEAFAGMSRVDRQRKVQDQLKAEFENGLHALTLKVQTPQEWKSPSVEKFESPNCMGKNKN